MIADDEVPVVARTWHVRSDNGGGLIYKFTHDDSGFLRLTADETVAIALCDGNRQLSRIRQLLAEMLGLSQEAVAGIWNGLSKKSDKNGFLVSLADAGSGFTRPDAARLFSEVAMQVHSSQLFRHLQVPLSLLIIPTYQCRTDCVYCYAERPALSGSEYLHPQRWVELLTEAGEFGLDLLTFSGGDPLTYPDIEDLLEVAKRYQMCCLLPTKTLITRQRANRLAELIRTSDPIQISVDSFDPEIAAMLTRTPGYAAIARESIRNLIAAGARVRTNTVVTPVNLAGIESLLRELQAMGVTRAHVTNYGRSHYRHDTQLFITDAQIEELNQTVLRLQTELDWPELKCNAGLRDFSTPGRNNSEQWRKRAACSGGLNAMTILPNGDVVLCEQVPHTAQFVVGNVHHDSLVDVWNSERLFEFVVPAREMFGSTPCKSCEEFDICHRAYGRCFRDAYFNYGTMYAPSPNCPQAPPGLRMS